MSEPSGLLRAMFSSEQLVKAMRTLDRTALIMVMVTWVGALIMMGIALYTVSSANKARQQTEEAAAVEPIVPHMQSTVVPRAELEKLAERLHNRFDRISFNAMPDNTLEIASTEAGNYLDWLTSLSYLDTIAPQIRWSVRDLCVGSECGSGAVMRAAVVGEKVTFKVPETVKPAGDGAVQPQKS